MTHSLTRSPTHPPYSLTHSLTHPPYSLTRSPTHPPYSLTHSLTHPPYSLTHSLAHPPTHPIHSLTHSLTHPPYSLTHSLTHSLTRSLTLAHSLAQSLTYSPTQNLTQQVGPPPASLGGPGSVCQRFSSRLNSLPSVEIVCVNARPGYTKQHHTTPAPPPTGMSPQDRPYYIYPSIMYYLLSSRDLFIVHVHARTRCDRLQVDYSSLSISANKLNFSELHVRSFFFFFGPLDES